MAFRDWPLIEQARSKESLGDEIDKLREALKPFAESAGCPERGRLLLERIKIDLESPNPGRVEWRTRLEDAVFEIERIRAALQDIAIGVGENILSQDAMRARAFDALNQQQRACKVCDGTGVIPVYGDDDVMCGDCCGTGYEKPNIQQGQSP